MSHDAARPVHPKVLQHCDDTACAASFDTIIAESDSPLAVGDTHGQYHYANRAFAELLGADPARVSGSHMRDWFSPDFAAERITVREQIIATMTPLHIVDVVRGHRLFIHMYPIVGRRWHRSVMICMSRRLRYETLDSPVATFKHHDLGPLGSLSRRELDVLKLIGEGLSQREIAERIHRTVKTVEAHRASLGKKLGFRKNIQLAQFALDSGLLDEGSSIWHPMVRETSDDVAAVLTSTN